MWAALWRADVSVALYVSELVVCLPEQDGPGVGTVRTYVRFPRWRPAVSPFAHPARRAGRPGQAGHAGGRAHPAGARTAGPVLPRWLPAPGDDRHGGGA